MPLISMRQILDHAAENNYGVPAFNINDMEQVMPIKSRLCRFMKWLKDTKNIL